MNPPKRAKALTGLLLVAFVPFLAAPVSDPCGACLGFWKYDLHIYEDIEQSVEVEDGQVYLVELGVVEGSADLIVFGDVDNLSCSVEPEGTQCTFDASADGEASFKVSAGAEGAETYMNFDLW